MSWAGCASIRYVCPAPALRFVVRTTRPGFLVLLAGVLSLAGAGCRTKPEVVEPNPLFSAQPPGSDVSPGVVAASGELGGRVMKALQASPHLRDATITVEVSNLTSGVVLKGKVRRAGQAKLALQIARKAAGKAKVESKINVIGQVGPIGRRQGARGQRDLP